jgi:type IV pilus assembly protein PilE
MNRTRSRGVTLIELLTVVVIVGILAGVALPSYRNYVVRANRTEAKAGLLQLTQSLEKCYTRFHSYDSGDGCEVTAATVATAQTTNYSFGIDVDGDGQTYTLTATPTGGQAERDGAGEPGGCGALAVNDLGQRFIKGTETMPAGSKCW